MSFRLLLHLQFWKLTIWFSVPYAIGWSLALHGAIRFKLKHMFNIEHHLRQSSIMIQISWISPHLANFQYPVSWCLLHCMHFSLFTSFHEFPNVYLYLRFPDIDFLYYGSLKDVIVFVPYVSCNRIFQQLLPIINFTILTSFIVET